MKKILFVTLLFSSLLVYSCNPKDGTNDPVTNDTIPVTPVDLSYNINIKDLIMRDPFVFADKTSKKYYIHTNSGDNKTFTVYESKDLEKWKKLGFSFVAPQDFWGKQDFWAPDMFLYDGKYYITATFSDTGIKRGCSVLVSDQPQGPYTPLTNEPVTPKDWGCLDATIFIDNGEPYLLYSHEWLETIDGEIYIQKLSKDLKTTVGDPILLFRASSAPWVGDITVSGITGKVTDAPFLYRISDKELIMIWSSFSKATGKYSIGAAHSTTGLITGPWVQDSNSLNDDDGGHAMIFKNLEGQLKIAYHSPNNYPNYVSIYDLDIFEGKVNILK